MGMNVGAIPYSSIDRYADRNGFDDPDEFTVLLRAVRACDRVFLDRQRKASEKSA